MVNMISIIAAIDPKGVIGRDNKLPWEIPDDMKHFRNATRNSVVIMGRKTWESIGRPLPGRVNIVVTSHEISNRDIIVRRSLRDAIGKAKSYNKEIYIIGGATLYKEALGVADRLILSHVKKEYEGDSYFPKFDKKDWKVITEKDMGEFVLRIYER